MVEPWPGDCQETLSLLLHEVRGIAAAQARLSEHLLLRFKQDGAATVALGKERRQSDASGRHSLDKDHDVHSLATHSQAWDEGAHSESDSGQAALPSEWPSSVRLREEFFDKRYGKHSREEKHALEKVLHERSTRTERADSTRRLERTHAGSLADGFGYHLKRFGALSPNSRTAVAEDITAMLVLMYELMLTPALISWKIDTGGVWFVLSWLSCIFWIFDLLLSFFVGFLDAAGTVILEQPIVARRYMKTWFGIDVTLIGVDVTVLLLLTLDGSPTNLLRAAKMSRMLKLLRTARLLRLLDKVSSALVSDNGKLALVLGKVFGVTLLINHFLCCLWFYIGGEAHSDTGRRWIFQLGAEEGAYDITDDSSRHYLWEYTTSFHWTLAQLTLGSHEVIPQNSAERLVSITLMVCGLLYGSTIVSFFSAQVIQIILLKQDQATLMSTLRRYLKQRSVPNRVAAQVVVQVHKRSSEHATLHDEDVSALALLSDSVRIKLRKAVRLPDLIHHPLVQVWARLSDDGIGALVGDAVEERFLSAFDDLFLPLQAATGAYCLSKGFMMYTPIHGDHFRPQCGVEEKAWLAEAALWSTWIHVGVARAQTDTSLLFTDAAQFFGVLKNFRMLLNISISYGRSYHARIAAALPPYAPHFPDDVEVPFCDPSALLSEEIGLELLHVARKHGKLEHLTDEMYTKLEAELQAGTSGIHCTNDEKIQRLVSLVSVSLHKRDEMLLQIGQIENGLTKIKVRLPGLKQASGELPVLTLERLFEGVLWPFAGDTVLIETEHKVERSESPTYGIDTTYVNTKFVMDLKEKSADFLTPPLQEKKDGPCMLLGGVETELNLSFVQADHKVNVLCWVKEGHVMELQSSENLQRLTSWAEEQDALSVTQLVLREL